MKDWGFLAVFAWLFLRVLNLFGWLDNRYERNRSSIVGEAPLDREAKNSLWIFAAWIAVIGAGTWLAGLFLKWW